jgi:aminopeptidase
VVHVCRLDEEDPIAAWSERIGALVDAAERLSRHHFVEVHFEGAGTDLHVGLLPTSKWICASFDTVDGIRHMPNLPSEEVFSAPDPQRVDGVVAATKPLDLQGTIVEGLRVTFEDGRVTQIDADANADALRARVALDDGAARLGEVALVDRQGRIGPLDTVFFNTLLDENAASHIAFGTGFPFLVEEPDVSRVNDSATHVDFMIGSPELDVDGVTADGERVPVLRGGDWQI